MKVTFQVYQTGATLFHPQSSALQLKGVYSLPFMSLKGQGSLKPSIVKEFQFLQLVTCKEVPWPASHLAAFDPPA